MTWFNKQSRLVQIILLLIPGVNWITELLVRWGTFLKKGGLIRLIVWILVTFFGLAFGWIDLIWVLLFKKLILQ
jgi:hypothetical protein